MAAFISISCIKILWPRKFQINLTQKIEKWGKQKKKNWSRDFDWWWSKKIWENRWVGKKTRSLPRSDDEIEKRHHSINQIKKKTLYCWYIYITKEEDFIRKNKIKKIKMNTRIYFIYLFVDKKKKNLFYFIHLKTLYFVGKIP